MLRPGGALCLATDSENIIRSREPLSIYWPETVEAELARYPRVKTLRAELREAGFVQLSALEVASRGSLTDSGPYRAKVFSYLRSLSEEIYQQGLARLEADLVQGPVSFTSKYMLLWANKDSGKDLAKHTNPRESSLATKLELPRDHRSSFSVSLVSSLSSFRYRT